MHAADKRETQMRIAYAKQAIPGTIRTRYIPRIYVQVYVILGVIPYYYINSTSATKHHTHTYTAL